ncbi:MAG: hypothetical protein PHE89_02035 [Alphaproteobacteria bacterium]|nr:hypothetical protein [Alphaproteobacteria bacterium]
MYYFYIDKEANPTTGEREIHKDFCSRLKKVKNKEFLGRFKTFKEAKEYALKRFGRAIGCSKCCPEGFRR